MLLALDIWPLGRRRFLTLDGVFTQGDVWLDGDYLGETRRLEFTHVPEAVRLVRPQRV